MQGVFYKKNKFQVNWASLVADFLLAGMVLGPIAAPYIANSSLPLTNLISQIIYFMGHYVCPQPDMGLTLSPPFIMAVCMRCYGTVTGLFFTRLLYKLTDGQGFFWLHQYGWSGTIIASILMMAYPSELAFEVLGWWNFNNYTVTIFGLITGLSWGLFTMPIFHQRST